MTTHEKSRLSPRVLFAAALLFAALVAPCSATLTTAATRDLNANGYLDAVELRFSQPLAFPAGYDLSSIIVYKNLQALRVMFAVATLAPAAGQTDSIFLLHLEENVLSAPGVPQSGWLPYITISGLAGESVDNRQCTDGASPLIWEVQKTVSSTNDRTRDKVTVTFSESIASPDGAALGFSTPPRDIFAVWTTRSADTVEAATILDGIVNFTEIGDDYVVFYMTNGNDLTGEHYLSIRTLPPRVADLDGNLPAQDNEKRRVAVRGDIGAMVVSPDTITPVQKYAETTLNHRDPGLVDTWIEEDGGLKIIASVALRDPNWQPDFRVTGKIQVYDPSGVIIYVRENTTNLIPDSWNDLQSPAVASELRNLVFYWNGIAENGSAITGGPYKLMVYLDTETHQQKYVGYVWAESGGEGPLSNCGTGLYMAFIPAVAVRALRTFRRRKCGPGRRGARSSQSVSALMLALWAMVLAPLSAHAFENQTGLMLNSFDSHSGRGIWGIAGVGGAVMAVADVDSRWTLIDARMTAGFNPTDWLVPSVSAAFGTTVVAGDADRSLAPQFVLAPGLHAAFSLSRIFVTGGVRFGSRLYLVTKSDAPDNYALHIDADACAGVNLGPARPFAAYRLCVHKNGFFNQASGGVAFAFLNEWLLMNAEWMVRFYSTYTPHYISLRVGSLLFAPNRT